VFIAPEGFDTRLYQADTLLTGEGRGGVRYQEAITDMHHKARCTEKNEIRYAAMVSRQNDKDGFQ
jgi:hypothetical protein